MCCSWTLAEEDLGPPASSSPVSCLMKAAPAGKPESGSAPGRQQSALMKTGSCSLQNPAD